MATHILAPDLRVPHHSAEVDQDRIPLLNGVLPADNRVLCGIDRTQRRGGSQSEGLSHDG